MNLPCDSTVYTMFRTTAKWRADALAIECGQQQWTYGQLLDVVDRLASVLLSEGAEPGDRVAILSENRAEYTMLQLACARIGAIVPCLNWRLVAAELDHCIGLVEPKLIFVSPRFKPLHDQVAYSGAPSRRHRHSACVEHVERPRRQRARPNPPRVEEPDLTLAGSPCVS